MPYDPRLHSARTGGERIIGLLLLILLACRFTAGSSTPTQEPATIPPTAPPTTAGRGAYDWSALEETLHTFVPDTVDGLTFLLAKDGEILYQTALGNQTRESVLPIASATKMPSAVVVLTLVDEGLLDLDVPVGPFLEDHLDWPQDKAAVTPRMLLNHTSGLVANPRCIGRRRSTLEACVQEIADAPLAFEPGTGFAYGGGSFQVAGYLAEVVSGRSWNELVQERLAQPLGLTQFTYSGGSLGSETNPRIAGGASSDVADYHRILQMILHEGDYNGVQVLSPELVGMMTESQIVDVAIVSSPADQDPHPGYSFGFWISNPSMHPGSEGPELSDQGAFGCTPWIDLDLGYAAVLLVKDRTNTGTEIWDGVRPIIIEQLGR